MISRVCNDCGEEKPLDDLVFNKKCQSQRRKLCKPCNVKRVLAKTDPEHKASYDKNRRADNLERLRNYDKQRASNPNRRALHNEETRRRRAALREAIPHDYDKEGVLAMYKLSQKLSRITGVVMHVDHIVPLARGGEHNTRNLQLLAGSLNIAKGANPHWQLPHTQYPAKAK